MIALTDTEILDEIEGIIDLFMQEFYASRSDDSKRVEAAFYIGQITGTVMRRGKPNAN